MVNFDQQLQFVIVDRRWLNIKLLQLDKRIYFAGAKWHQRRKILTPTFHFNILRHFNAILEENSRKLVEELAAEVGKDYTDVATYITQFTLHSICGKHIFIIES